MLQTVGYGAVYCPVIKFSPSPGDGENAPNFARNLTLSSVGEFHNQTTQRTKMGKYSFKSEIIALRFGEKYTSLLRIFEEPWRTCWRWPSSRLQLAVKYHEIISSMLCWMLHHLCTVSTWDSHRAGRQYQWRWTWMFWRRCRSESGCKAEGARCYPDQFTERATES